MSKLKKLVAAVSLASAGFIAAPAHAVIDDANMPQLGSNISFTNTGGGGGELFVSIVARDAGDPANNQSYVRDLGVTADDFFYNPAGQNGLAFAPDATLTNFLAANAGKDINFQITGVHNPDLIDFGLFTGIDLGYTVSVNQGADVNTSVGTNAGFNGAGQDFDNFVGAINLALDATPTAGNPVLAPASIAVNSSGTFAPGDNGFHDAPNWGANPFGVNSEGDIGGAVDFWFIGLDNADNTVSRAPAFLGSWTLDGAGNLEFQAIPIPAAAWLFGSAVLGMAGVNRRRKA